MLRSTFLVTAADGSPLGTAESIEDLKAIVADHPGAQFKSVVTILNPCERHASFEADNCPTCGTAAKI
jgi:hypothetical protein